MLQQYLGYYTHNGVGYIFMSFIDGRPLNDAVLYSYSPEQRSSLADSLLSVITRLQDIPPAPPSSAIGGLAGSAPLILPPDFPPSSFPSEVSLYTFMSNYIGDLFGQSAVWASLKTLATRPTSRDLRFVHGDLAGRNLLVRDARIVGLLDWEWSGWYPKEFEAARGVSELRARPSRVAEVILGHLRVQDSDLVNKLVEFYGCLP